MDEDRTKIEFEPRKYDAIHRALLTGLLGNVGLKTDSHEYTGARGTKFHIFPGSALFAKKPQWIVAAEIVETTRLYARTVAKIQPQWIERLAEHLVERSYSEPHWQSGTAHVVAHEKVTLYGLAIVPRRLVHYGPIKPAEARAIFIHHALVEQDLRTEAPFFKHNRALIDEIERLESKVRRRDLLADARVRFDFYDARIPADVYNGPLLEKWRREAEKRDPKLLFMTPEMLLRQPAPATAEQFPDHVQTGQMRLPLAYALAPGEGHDGVTVTVPLAAINQLPDERFEWLVPGMLDDKIIALIRSLPKHLRTNFIPAPDFAARAQRMMPTSDRNGSLLEALAGALGKISGLQISPGDFQLDLLPPHLRMNFRVIDVNGKELAISRDLDAIRRDIGGAARSSFAAPSSQFTREKIMRWDFPDLPPSIDVQRHGMALKGYPALVDAGDSVSLRLLDSPAAADEAMRAGLRRLLMLQLGEDFKRLARSMAGITQMRLHYATIGGGDELVTDMMHAIADRALFPRGDEPLIRTRDEFIERAELAWRKLQPAANDIAQLVGQALESYQAVATRLATRTPPAWAPSIKDARDHVAHLLPRGFVTRTPSQWLVHLPRFVKAVDVRLSKLANAGLTRDLQQLAVVRPLWEQYRARREKHLKLAIVDPALEQYRWMLEELRVSLFAQELKTSMPISPQRLEKQWKLVR